MSEEEKRGRRHKNKVVLEAERQAKAALDKVEKYAVLATVDKQELTSLCSISRHLFKRQWMLLRKNLPFLLLHLSDKRLGERNGQQTSMTLSRLL